MERNDDAQRYPCCSVKTAAWLESATSGSGWSRYRRVTHNWLRFDPPALAWRHDCGSHSLHDARGHLSTSDGSDSCHLTPGVRYGPFESLTQYLPALSRPADEGL